MRQKKGKKWILTVLFVAAVLGLVFRTTISRTDVKSMLSKEVYSCRELVNTAGRGTQKGAYPDTAVDTFAEQVEAAAAVLADMDAGEEEAKKALEELKAAKEVFQNSVNTEDGTEKGQDTAAGTQKKQISETAKAGKREKAAAETSAETEAADDEQGASAEEEAAQGAAKGSRAAQKDTENQEAAGNTGDSTLSGDTPVTPDSMLNVNKGSGNGGASYRENSTKAEEKEKKDQKTDGDTAKADKNISLDFSDKKTETKQDTTENSGNSGTTSTEKETKPSGSSGTDSASGDSSGGSSANTPSSEKPSQPETTPGTEEKKRTCTITIRCETILNNMDNLKAGLAGYVPANGIILPASKIQLYDGETVFDVLKRVTRATGLKLEFRNDGVHGAGYIVGINHLNEFDCGVGSGWMYTVNGWYPNYGCGKYVLNDGDSIQWIYTCDLGRDIGGDFWE